MNKILIVNKKNNSLNFVRLIAALQVFIVHSTYHLDININENTLKILNVFQGVPIFFILSGFFIWDSIGYSTSFKDYFKKRILRIYPELWFAVALNLIMIVLLFKGKIEWFMFLLFQITQSTFMQFWTPEFLRSYGVGTPNGSLWTISITLQSYLVLYFLNKYLSNKKIVSWILILVVGIIFNIFVPIMLRKLLDEIIYKLYMQTFFTYIWLFILGAFISDFFNRIISILRGSWLIFIGIALFIAWANYDFGVYGTFKSICVAFFIIGFAYSFPKIKFKNDISYEIFLYHMIVINAMVHLNYTNHPGYLIISLLLTLVLANISSYFYQCIKRC